MPPPPIQEEPDDEEWLGTFADTIALLLAFFVMLLSISTIDPNKFESAIDGIKDEIGGVGKEATQTTSQELKTAIESAAFEVQMEQVVEVQKDERGITIEMASTSFFKPGTTEILAAAHPLLKSWSALLIDEKFKYFYIEVEGHTDDDPISTEKFPSNWELSADRAAAVVRFMGGEGVHPFQLKAIGLADSHPKAPNRDQLGVAIPANQAKNRRVVIRLVQMVKNDKEEFQNVLLEQRLAEEERKRREEQAKADAAADAAAAAAAGQGGAPTPAEAVPAPTQ
ncbi:MAG: flagellar motor protein MotB [Rhodospirillales bacterium]|nr:flagellar motor protein MotB [Rhodospirillales bacterium]